MPAANLHCQCCELERPKDNYHSNYHHVSAIEYAIYLLCVSLCDIKITYNYMYF